MVLTPQARAIAAFTLAVTVLLGTWDRAGYALLRLFGSPDLTASAFGAVVVAVVPLAVAVLAYVLAQGGVTGDEADRWEAHLAGAARLLAAAAVVLTALMLIAGIVHGAPGFGPVF